MVSTKRKLLDKNSIGEIFLCYVCGEEISPEEVLLNYCDKCAKAAKITQLLCNKEW